MKILFIVPYYTPAYSYGGVVRATETQAEGLVKRGFEVTVATTDVLNNTDRNKIKQEIINGVNIIRFPNISNYVAKHLNFYTAYGLSKWIKDNIKQFQLIHISDIYSFLMIKPTVKLAVKYKIPYMIQPHGLLLPYRVSYNKILKLIKNLIINNYKQIFDKSTAIISLPEQETMYLKTLFPNKDIVEIPNGIRPKIRTNNKLVNDSHYENKKKILVSIGRLHQIKGFERAIHTIYALRKLYIDFEYLIYGPSEKDYGNYLQNLIDKLSANDYIKLKGPVYNEEIDNVLTKADLFVMPSISEAQSIVILEALNCGLPAIVSKETYIQVYEGYKCCIKSDFNNYSQTAETLNRILNNPEELAKMRDDTPKLIDEKFSSDIFIDKLADLYSSIINN